MRNLLVLVTLLFRAPAFADYCTSFLKDGNYTVKQFSGYGYNQYEACDQAMRECRYEKQRLTYDRRYRNLYCTTGFDGRPVKQTCTYQMVVQRRNGRVRVINEFSAVGVNEFRACNKAQNKCSRDLRHAPYGARCVKKYGNGGGNRDFVTRSCTAKKTTRRGRIEYFYGSASGLRGSGVKRKACNKAMRQCEMSGRGRGFCSIQR